MNFFSYIVKFFKNLTTPSKNELFQTEDYNRPNHLNYKICPQCGIEGSTNKDIIDIFGKRTAHGHPDVQSWCKNCRKNKRKNNQDENEIESLF